MKNKKNCLLVLSFFLLYNASADPRVNKEPVLTIVKGTFEKEKSTTLWLQEVVAGKKEDVASVKIDAGHNFAFALTTPKEGFYYLTDQVKRKSIRLYIKPGDQLELAADEDSYTFLKASPENKVLYDWGKAAEFVLKNSSMLSRDSCTFHSFFPALENIVPISKSFSKKINTPNARFNALMKMTVENDVEFAAMSFLLLPNTTHPKKDQYPAFYNTIIKPSKYCSAQILELGDAIDMLNRYTTFNSIMNRDTTKSYKGLWAIDMFCNDTIKGAYIATAVGRFRTYEEIETAVAPYQKYLVLPSFKNAYFDALKGVANFKKGNPSFNFSYPDVAGKNVSMKDLKGKVVVVDVWATWCGPCKAQIPALKTLEKEFRDKDVEFVSISVDEEKDHEKWKSFIAKEELGGTQLFAKGWSEITKYYEIKGIPRFMVFDKEGKIVSTDGPRPSTPELKELLLTTLEGK